MGGGEVAGHTVKAADNGFLLIPLFYNDFDVGVLLC